MYCIMHSADTLYNQYQLYTIYSAHGIMVTVMTSNIGFCVVVQKSVSASV